ncbi:DUF1240 domain-containing protein [Morganella morganii]|uniref:DUF1240 domain-containing protein n=1 Tax=Morganella morganii TaxID=582 RepID=UPI001A2DE8C5|nr:DUF1240 domain-containing protein [Morganella morganii]MCU6233620.1 DUF1240 domain-containing protein [Morganella morganii]MCU6238557.1 DUF1240 domain-containing protein [Morganella morganii]MCU6275610.1 DUF1240 domain-containing protein [Morganella morganii]HAT1528266.1 DUF1240 domain-containing protein [Morganella morganii]
MSEIKPVKMYLISSILIFSIAIGSYDSVISYVDYFIKSDIISFSFPLGLIVFASPLLAWSSYLLIIVGYRKQKNKLKEKVKVNNKLMSLLAAIAIFGIIFSFFFSFYVEYDLTSRGYVKCHKKSIHAPTKYIISKDMCE